MNIADATMEILKPLIGAGVGYLIGRSRDKRFRISEEIYPFKNALIRFIYDSDDFFPHLSESTRITISNGLPFCCRKRFDREAEKYQEYYTDGLETHISYGGSDDIRRPWKSDQDRRLEFIDSHCKVLLRYLKKF